jgi:hypothetical protein
MPCRILAVYLESQLSARPGIGIVYNDTWKSLTYQRSKRSISEKQQEPVITISSCQLQHRGYLTFADTVSNDDDDAQVVPPCAFIGSIWLFPFSAISQQFTTNACFSPFPYCAFLPVRISNNTNEMARQTDTRHNTIQHTYIPWHVLPARGEVTEYVVRG